MSERIIKSVSISGSKEEWMEALAASRTPPTSQSDDALVEELARALWIAQGWRAGIWDGTDGARWTAYGEERKPKWRKVARAILPILTAREASARAEGRREGIEEAAKIVESAMFNEYGRPQPVLVAALRALTEKQP